MKVTYNWLKDFVEIKIPAQKLADRLTMAGLEVTSLEGRGGDFVFEIEVTPNRPDCLSVRGIAREAAAIVNSKLKTQNSKLKIENFKKENLAFKIEIKDRKDCPLYTAKIIRDVKVGPSPDWLKKRLELVGCRSVNNIVDITNYVLFESGEPLHAFDLDKIVRRFAGSQVLSLEIIIRRAKNGEEITTIDGIKRVLSEETLVIASKVDELTNSRTKELANQPIAIAGIMGGQDTEVTEGTKNVLLEAAVFNPIIVRRSRQALGLESESAYRFERGINSRIVEEASLRAAALIQELAGGRCVLVKSVGNPKTESKSIGLDASTVQKILGASMAPVKIKQILNTLGFKVKTKAKNNFTVAIPSHRPDVSLEIDLIEEVARIFGYENIANTVPAVKPQISARVTETPVSLIKNILVAMGLNEVITYSLIDKDLLHSFGREQESNVIEILNPLSKEQEILRPSLIPSLARCVADNLNQKQVYINIFEIAKVFSGAKENPEEELALGVALCGVKSLWFGQGHIQDEVGFLHLKGILDALFQRLGIKKEEYRFINKDAYEFEVQVKEVKIGVLKKLERAILDRLDIKNNEVFTLEITLQKIVPSIRIDKKFIPLARYPGVSRDISLVLKEDIPVAWIIKVIRERGTDLLKEVETTDYYKGKQIEPGFKGLTISCAYSSPERTLTEAEVTPLHAGIIQALKEELQVKIR